MPRSTLAFSSSYRPSAPPYAELNQNDDDAPPYAEMNEEDKPLRDPSTFELDAADQEILQLRQKLRRTKLILRLTVIFLSVTILVSIFTYFFHPLKWLMPGTDGSPLTPVPESQFPMLQP